MLSQTSGLSPPEVMLHPWVTRQEKHHRPGNTNIYLKRKPKVSGTQKKRAGEERKRALFLLIFRWAHSFGSRAKDASSLVDIISMPAPQRQLDPPGNDGSQQGESSSPGDGAQGLNPVVVQKTGRIHRAGRVWTRGGCARDHVDPFHLCKLRGDWMEDPSPTARWAAWGFTSLSSMLAKSLSSGQWSSKVGF